jgi:Ca2+/Na+ antiporter
VIAAIFLITGIVIGACLLIVSARIASRRRFQRDSILRTVLDINAMVMEARSRLVDVALDAIRREQK